MLQHIDDTLHHLLRTRVTGLRLNPQDPATVQPDQIGFQPPDDDWRQQVTGLGTRKALNVYLVDLRENRDLRSNQRTQHVANGMVSHQPAPGRMDCHYLITAWSPATEDAGKTPDEHQLLYEVTAILMQSQPFVPSAIFDPDPLPAGFPDLIADAELPTTILPVEGFPKLAEFWGAMGADHRWKPAVYLVVTIPVALQPEVAGPMVTTRITEYRVVGKPETAETWTQIGGHVLDAAVLDPDTGEPTPVADAWVQLQNDNGDPLQTVTTKQDGRFTFGRLQAGQYSLTFRVQGRPPQPDRPITVPSPTGEYDLIFP